MHTRVTGKKEKAEIKTVDDKPATGEYIKWDQEGVEVSTH